MNLSKTSYTHNTPTLLPAPRPTTSAPCPPKCPRTRAPAAAPARAPWRRKAPLCYDIQRRKRLATQ